LVNRKSKVIFLTKDKKKTKTKENKANVFVFCVEKHLFVKKKSKFSPKNLKVEAVIHLTSYQFHHQQQFTSSFSRHNFSWLLFFEVKWIFGFGRIRGLIFLLVIRRYYNALKSVVKKLIKK